MEGRPGAQFAFDPCAATVYFDHVLDDRKAQTCPARLTGAGLIDAIETLEDTLDVLRGDTGTKVLHKELDFALNQLRTDNDLLSLPSVLQRVLNQVAKDLVHRIGIGHHRNVGRAGRFQLKVGVDDDTAQ
jgi:hypothetical protein